MLDDPDQPREDRSAAVASRRGRHFRSRGKARHAGSLRRWPRRLLVTINILVLLMIAGSATAVGFVVYEYQQIKRQHVGGLYAETPSASAGHGHKAAAPAGKPPFTVLIIGSDSRQGAAKVGVNIGNAATNSENLSDVILLARVAPATHKVALLSVPRDLEVNVPGIGPSKINAAFSGGDPTRLVHVIENDLHIKVNHYAAVNFLAVEEIANAIGGVKQFFPTPAKDPYSNLKVAHAGCVNLVGAQALAFVRSRHYYYERDGEYQPQNDPESDLGRIQRQQAFIRDSIKKAERNGDLTNPLTLKNIISSVAGNLTLDTTFSVNDLISLGNAFRHINASKIPSVTYSATNAVQNGADVLLPQPAADAAEVKKFLAVGSTPAKKTGKAKSTPSTTSPPTTVPPHSISVRVENGSGAAGQAATASIALQSAGFIVSASTDAPNFGYSSNVIDYGPSGLKAAQTLRAALTNGATLTPDQALSGSNLTLITGTDFAGVSTSTSTGSSASTTTTTVPSTTTTLSPYGSPYYSATKVSDQTVSSSTYYKGLYIPPGRLPGQKIDTCGN